MIKINNIDLASMGIILLRGGDNDIFSFPERKDPPQNDWFEQNGLDVDLSESFFNARKIALKFRLKAISTIDFDSKMEAFESLLFSSGNKSVYFSIYNLTLQLRFISISNFRFVGKLSQAGNKIAEFTCDFCEDAPLEMFTDDLEPSEGIIVNNRLKINNYEFSYFGVVVNKIYDTALTTNSPKGVLERTFVRYSGQIADSECVAAKKAKNITIQCRLNWISISAFIVNWSSLFNQLNLYHSVNFPNGIEILINESKLLKCYYKSMSVSRVHYKNGSISIDFSINLINHVIGE